jgi:arylsulfatase A-like enzyme
MKFFSRIFRFYQGYVMPKINHLRGSDALRRKVLNPLAGMDFPDPEEEPTHIFDREWDNLIILDACRHDVYQEVRDRDVDYIYSVGSHSREFVENTFSEDRDFSDVVYITANGHISPGKFEKFTGKRIEDTFHTVFDPFANDWDDDVSGIPPEAVARDARTAEKLFPDKKKIIHFMQPHYPFLGSEIDVGYSYPRPHERDYEKIRKAYAECLEYTLDFVDELVEDLEGKTVITADHGEFLGEKDMIKHPYGVKAETLRKVPWHIVKED